MPRPLIGRMTHERRRLHARQRAIRSIVVGKNVGFLPRIEAENVKSDRVFTPGFTRRSSIEAAEQQPGASEQHHRKRELGDDKHAARALIRRRCRAFLRASASARTALASCHAGMASEEQSRDDATPRA